MKSILNFIRHGYVLQYDDFKKYEKRKLNQSNIADMVGEMEADYRGMEDDKERKMVELKLKDIKTDIDKFTLISILITIYIQLVPNLFKVFGEENASIVWTIVLVLVYIIISRFISKSINLYRIFNLYLNVIDTIKSNKQLHGNSNLDEEESKGYVIRIKEV